MLTPKILVSVIMTWDHSSYEEISKESLRRVHISTPILWRSDFSHANRNLMEDSQALLTVPKPK